MGNGILNVFTYHRILPEPSGDGVSVRMFERQLDELLVRYDRILSGDQLGEFLAGADGFGGLNAAITFDDGWLDNWLIATPVLQDKGVPAILDLATGFLHEGPVRTDSNCPEAGQSCERAQENFYRSDDPGGFLSCDEVRAMLDSGVWSIQAHGHAHRRTYYRVVDAYALLGELKERQARGIPIDAGPDGPSAGCELVSELACRRRSVNPQVLSTLSDGDSTTDVLLAEDVDLIPYAETNEEFTGRLRRDFEVCRSKIADLTGRVPELLFWPWGHYSEASLKIAESCGFRFTFSVDKGLVRGRAPVRVVPRISVSEKWLKFRRNGLVYRSSFLARVHDLISPSPSGLKLDGA